MFAGGKDMKRFTLRWTVHYTYCCTVSQHPVAGLQWTVYIKYVAQCDIIVMYWIRHCHRPSELNLQFTVFSVKISSNHGSSKMCCIYFQILTFQTSTPKQYFWNALSSSFLRISTFHKLSIGRSHCCCACVGLGLYSHDQINCLFRTVKLVSTSVCICHEL